MSDTVVDSTWALGASTLGAPGESLESVIAALAACGARHVELRAADDALVNTALDATHRAEIRTRLADAGIHVLSVASGLHAAGSGAPGSTMVDDLRRHLQLGADLGASFVRVFPSAPTHDCPFDEVPQTIGNRADHEATAARRLATVVGQAGELGVWPVLETHDSNPRGQDIARILSQVDELVPGHRIGAIWDALHPWRTGEDPADTWAALHRYLLDGRGYVQIKDVASPTDLTPVLQGRGVVPVPRIVQILAAGGYRGPLSLEWERTWYPQVPPLREALSAAAEVIASLAHRAPRSTGALHVSHAEPVTTTTSDGGVVT